MKLLTVLGAVLGLVGAVLGIIEGSEALINSGGSSGYGIIYAVIGIVVAIFTLQCATKPDSPLPFHWAVLLVLGILLIVFIGGVLGILAGVLLIIAFLIGLIEDL